MSALERRCRLLLRVYPAAYRDVRGEEIIGTLLEATPSGRSWPRPRDIRGLVFGGLRARAAFNRQLTTAANLRVAVLAGVAAYLAFNAVAVSFAVAAEVSTYGRTPAESFDWPILLAWVLTLLAVGVAMLTSRRAMVLAAALPAAAVACYAGPWGASASVGIGTHLVCLAGLVALAGGKRPLRRWLVPVGLLAALPAVSLIQPAFGFLLYAPLLFSIAGISIMWIVIDARPAIAMLVFFLALWLPFAVVNLVQGFGLLAVPELVIATVVGVPAVWLLRRQSAHPGRPTRA
jgi:hypothetical protein